MTDTQREAFEAKFPAPVGVTLFGKEYVWFGGNDHGKTCDFYNDMWKAFQAGLEANTMQLQAIYDDMYRHKDIAQVAQKLFILLNGQAALAHSQQECDWKPFDDDSMPNTYEGKCGIVWTFTEGNVTDNECVFCPRCGGKINEAITNRKD